MPLGVSRMDIAGLEFPKGSSGVARAGGVLQCHPSLLAGGRESSSQQAALEPLHMLLALPASASLLPTRTRSFPPTCHPTMATSTQESLRPTAPGISASLSLHSLPIPHFDVRYRGLV